MDGDDARGQIRDRATRACSEALQDTVCWTREGGGVVFFVCVRVTRCVPKVCAGQRLYPVYGLKLFGN